MTTARNFTGHTLATIRRQYGMKPSKGTAMSRRRAPTTPALTDIGSGESNIRFARSRMGMDEVSRPNGYHLKNGSPNAPRDYSGEDRWG